MFLLFLAFMFCFLGMILTAYFSIESMNALSSSYSISDSFMGAAFLAMGTSFPEFINSMVAGFSDVLPAKPELSMYSFYNVTGANIWQMVFVAASLSLILLYFAKSKKINQNSEFQNISNIFWSHSYLSWKLTVMDTTILLLVISFPHFSNAFMYKGFNCLNLMFVIIWIWYIWKTYQQSDSYANQTKQTFFTSLSNKSLIFSTLCLWLLFGAFAYGNFYISSLFPMGTSTSFGMMLSFITSTPEFSVLFFLFSQKKWKMALGGLFGSSLFNLILPSMTNMISSNPIFSSDFYYQQSNSFSGLSNWLFLNMFLLALFPCSFLKSSFFNSKNYSVLPMFNGLLILFIYMFSNLLFSF